MAKILRPRNSEFRNLSGRVFFIHLITLLLGCGYQMVGKETHIPSGLNSVAIPTFVNQTFEPGIEVPITQGFLREFIQDRRVKVLDRSEADSVLEGVIKSFNIYSVSYDRSGLVLEYQTTIIMDLTLKKRTGEIVWVMKDFSESTGSGFLRCPGERANKTAAIQQIGRFVAERLRTRFFYDF